MVDVVVRLATTTRETLSRRRRHFFSLFFLFFLRVSPTLPIILTAPRASI